MTSLPLDTTLPSTAELPCSDETPVDNEEQNLLPNLLLFLLTSHWSERMDWYFGVDMAVYHTTGTNPRVPVVPDAFLSLGVKRIKERKYRRSYATWEENDIVPVMILEMVSHTPNDEYHDTLAFYAKLGVLYYVIYNPEFWQRDRHQPFEVYKLAQQTYHLQRGEPYWMPEVGLGIGRSREILGGIEREVLLWYDRQSQAYSLPEGLIQDLQQQIAAEQQRTESERQRAEAERQRAEAEHQRAEAEHQETKRLADYLRSLGIDPDHLPTQ